MLGSREKKILDYFKYRKRLEDFRLAQQAGGMSVTFNEYLKFLSDVQAVFGTFKVSRRPTVTKNNKL